VFHPPRQLLALSLAAAALTLTVGLSAAEAKTPRPNAAGTFVGTGCGFSLGYAWSNFPKARAVKLSIHDDDGEEVHHLDNTVGSTGSGD
jgi:hypothetical protein